MKLRTIAALLLAGLAGTASASSLKVEFKVPEGVAVEYKEVTLRVLHLVEKDGQQTSEPITEETFTTKEFSKTFDNLSAGQYFLIVFTGEKDRYRDATRPSPFFTTQQFELGADENRVETITYKAFDPESLKGEESFSGKVLRASLEPVAGKTYSVQGISQTAGLYPVGTVTTDAEGKFSFKGLKKDSVYFLMDGPDNRLAQIKGGDPTTVEVRIAPGVGEVAPEIEVQKLDDGTPVKLSSLRGKVVVLDFWATWCGPCQAPMAKMNTYREAHPEWGDKVELVALSIDDTKDVIEKHIAKKGWTKVLNTWAGGGFNSKAPQLYGVDSIPRLYIIGKDGKIAFAGHPAEVNTSEKVAELLKQG